MRIRGAAAIGCSAAQALADHVVTAAGGLEALRQAVVAGAERLRATRPTAVSLRHALAPVVAAVFAAPDPEVARRDAREAAGVFAGRVRAAQEEIARLGADLLPAGARVLTHCHSTAVVDILAAAYHAGRCIEVWTDETRPFWQGRITSRALAEAGIPVTLMVDSAAHSALTRLDIDHVLVGADTVAGDGSLFNKVGTAAVALSAQECGVPFHAAAATYKFTSEPAGSIRIEERDPDEVAAPGERAAGVRVWNPVFDRTPPDRVTAYITEKGVLPPMEAVRAALADLEVTP